MIVLWLAAGVLAKGSDTPVEKDPVRGGRFVHVKDFSALKNLVQPVEWQDRKEEQEEQSVQKTPKPNVVYKASALDAVALRMMLKEMPKSERAKPQIVVIGTDPTDQDEAAIIQMIAELL